MPVVIIEGLEGRSVEQKRNLVREVTESVSRNFNVASESVTIIIHEIKKENSAKNGILKIDRDSKK